MTREEATQMATKAVGQMGPRAGEVIRNVADAIERAFHMGQEAQRLAEAMLHAAKPK